MRPPMQWTHARAQLQASARVGGLADARRRRVLVPLAAVVALVSSATACGDAQPPRAGSSASESAKGAVAPPPTAVPSTPMFNPHETAEAVAAKQPMLQSQKGSFDLVINGQVRRLPHLPLGQNAAVYFEGKKGRISVSGASQEGYPSFTAEMIGWRLDQLSLPITLSGDGKQLVRFRYRVGERGDYTSDNEATKRGENTVTLESYEGNVLTGTFQGTVAPKLATLGEPLVVSGKFSTELRLRGVLRSEQAGVGVKPASESPKAAGPGGRADAR